jgi:hypothetical protein
VIAEIEPEAACPTEFEPEGAEITRATTVNESAPAIVHPAGRLSVTGVEQRTSARQVATVPTVIEVGEFVVTACDGTTDNIPKPKAATVTSATRLKVVFVDICFLSISRSREFPWFGLKLKFLTSFSMNRTC